MPFELLRLPAARDPVQPLDQLRPQPGVDPEGMHADHLFGLLADQPLVCRIDLDDAVVERPAGLVGDVSPIATASDICSKAAGRCRGAAARRRCRQPLAPVDSDPPWTAFATLSPFSGSSALPHRRRDQPFAFPGQDSRQLARQGRQTRASSHWHPVRTSGIRVSRRTAPARPGAELRAVAEDRRQPPTAP